MKKRITLRDIGSACGYHFSTVSLALRGDPSIPEATRRRIQETAAKMGYSPDPVLAALVAYRQERAPPDYAGTIIWLTDNSKEFHWRDVPHNQGYFTGAEKEAKERGFVLEELDLGSPGMNPVRAKQILHARRINCLLVPPHPSSQACKDLDWEQFYAVFLNSSSESAARHVVSSNHPKAMIELMEQLNHLGYRRPALVLRETSNHEVTDQLVAAYLGRVFRNEGFISMRPLCLPAWEANSFNRWFDEQKPDVLIGSSLANPELLPHLSALGLSVPADIGFADYNLPHQEDKYAGMKQNAEKIGRIAVADLISLYHRNESGHSTSPGLHALIDSTWYNGPTVCTPRQHSKNLPRSSEEGPGKSFWGPFGLCKESKLLPKPV